MLLSERVKNIDHGPSVHCLKHGVCVLNCTASCNTKRVLNAESEAKLKDTNTKDNK